MSNTGTAALLIPLGMATVGGVVMLGGCVLVTLTGSAALRWMGVP